MAGDAATRPDCRLSGRVRRSGSVSNSEDQRGVRISADQHFEQLSRWMDLESEVEVARLAERKRGLNGPQAERSGETLLDLVITGSDSGLGGRCLLRLVKRNRTLSLPWNRLRPGSPVVLTAADGADTVAPGVVTDRSRDSIEIAVDEWPEGDLFRIDLSTDEIVRKRIQSALRAASGVRGRARDLARVLLGEREPRFRPEGELLCRVPLNEPQQAAIRFALSAEDVAIIHGPPGTGKTTTVVELICQAVARGDRVLACAPSNTAVDNLLDRLLTAGRRAVRVGHPARVEERLRDFTLDALAADHEAMRVVRDMLREAEEMFRRAGRFTRARPAPGTKQDMRREARQLKKDARLLEQQAVESVLDRAEVVCATTTFDPDIFGDRRFGLVVIDEACQGTEPACWIPVLYADRLVLAGDHRQLPPTVLSAQAARDGLSRSLLERLADMYGDLVTRRLEIQYRMHADIMRFSSEQFYDGALVAHESVSAHLLRDLRGMADGPLTSDAVTFIDSAGAGWDEEVEPDGDSRRNPQEAALVVRKVRQLCAAGMRPCDIAVITPYAAQVRCLRELCEDDDLEIDTVDGFQGREKEAVIISCVRSSTVGGIGFLADTRRMNVALTRARRRLIVIGDSATLGGHEFYAALLEYFESIGAYHTVWEEPEDVE